MARHLRTTLCGLLTAALAALAAIACTRSDSSEDIVQRSIDAFGATSSYQTTFEVKTSSEAVSIKTNGEAAYQGGHTVFSKISIVVDPPDQQDVNELLFLPPDLYLRTTEDAWYVQSPWNQGIRPSEVPEYGFDDPIIDYPAVAGELSNIERMPDEKSGSGETLLVFAGKEALDFPAEAPPGAKGKFRVEIRLHPDTYLPAAVRTTTGVSSEEGSFALDISSQFLAYDEAVSAPPRPPSVRPWRDFQFPQAVCTGDKFAACLAPQTAIQPTGACSGTGRRICFVPLGQISPQLVQHLVDHYRSQYSLTVEVLTPSAVREDLADPLRNQIDASTMIEYMGGLFPEVYADQNAVLIGLTPLDLYDSTSHFRYLFGVKGDVSDPGAVVSAFRMDPQFYGDTPDDALYFSRYRTADEVCRPPLLRPAHKPRPEEPHVRPHPRSRRPRPHAGATPSGRLPLTSPTCVALP